MRLAFGGFSASLCSYFSVFYNEDILLFNRKKKQKKTNDQSQMNQLHQENGHFKKEQWTNTQTQGVKP